MKVLTIIILLSISLISSTLDISKLFTLEEFENNGKITKEHYKSGNVKKKIVLYNKPIANNKDQIKLKLIIEYYDSVKIKPAKMTVFLFKIKLLEKIFDINGKIKCSSEAYLPNNLFEDYDNSSTNVKLTISDILELFGTYTTSYTCNYRTLFRNKVYFRYKIEYNIEHQAIKLIRGYGYDKFNTNALDEAENIINKYFKKDEDISVKLKSLIE